MVSFALPAARAEDEPAVPAEDVPAVPHWIFAVEDTADLPASFEMFKIEVRADRVGIGEIVQRCIEGEGELSARIRTLEYTALVKSVLYVGGRDREARRLVTEQVDRKFFRRPDHEKTIPLKFRQYELVDGKEEKWDPDDSDPVRIGYEVFDELPFYLQDSEQYDFRILSREIVGDRVIYEVRLTPKSDFEIAPSGRIWIDTSGYQILREEFDFGDRAPLPMFIKSLGPFVRERERVGDLWVWKRFLIRVDLRMGYLRFLDNDIPDRVEFAVTFQDYRVNEGWSTDEPAADRVGGGDDEGAEANE